MSDLFDNISGKISEVSVVMEKSKKVADDIPPKLDSVQSKDRVTKSKESTSKDVGTSKESSSSRSSVSGRSVDKLAEIMATGFNDLKELLKAQYAQNIQVCQEPQEWEEFSENFEEPESELDMFDSFSDICDSNEKLGAPVKSSLASLTDKLLQLKVDDSVVKDKRDLYSRPQNVQYLEAPKLNKPIWSSVNHQVQITDSLLQSIEADFLASAIPTISVMEKIFNAKDDMASLNANELIDTLKDSLIFLGSANVNMVKSRRKLVKKVLPNHMHGLCSDTIQFSSSNLFGDDLNSSVKEVSELNRISRSFQPRGIPVRGRRGQFSRGSRGRGARRGASTAFTRKYRPYNASATSGKKALNRRSPSRK